LREVLGQISTPSNYAPKQELEIFEHANTSPEGSYKVNRQLLEEYRTVSENNVSLSSRGYGMDRAEEQKLTMSMLTKSCDSSSPPNDSIQTSAYSKLEKDLAKIQTKIKGLEKKIKSKTRKSKNYSIEEDLYGEEEMSYDQVNCKAFFEGFLGGFNVF
jgi:hypothetical protein